MRSMRALIVIIALVTPALVAAPTVALAQESVLNDTSSHERAQHVDLFAILGVFGYFHLGIGGWYAYPIVPDGFIPNLNETFFIEVGAAVERYSWSYGFIGADCTLTWYRLTPLGGVRWSFYLNDEWTVFATGKLGFGIGFADSWTCGGISGGVGSTNISSLAFDGGVGAHWRLDDTWSMRFSVGYFGANVGAGMDL